MMNKNSKKKDKEGNSDPQKEISSSLLYRKTENIQEILDQLRDRYIAYKESSVRCQLEYKAQNHDEPSRNFYFKPRIPFLEEPDKQKQFRKKFMQEVGQAPEPEPLTLIADNLQHQLLETIGDRSDPSVIRNDLALFYKRRLAYLQHKKYKILHRWANQALTSELIDKVGMDLDLTLGRIQQEIDQSINRIDRLSIEDNFDNAENADRPHPISQVEDIIKPLYVENRIFRASQKLVLELKWIPYSSRFEVWANSREMMVDQKHDFNEKKFQRYLEISKKIKKKLVFNGITDEKALQDSIEKFTKHLKGEEFISRQDQLLNSHLCNHEAPPLIIANNIELKINLIDLAREFGITGDLEIDSGHSFTYQVQVYFPSHFQKQVLMLTFDWYDTSQNQDNEMVEKISNNLTINKTQILNQIAKLSEAERKKSVIGNINKEQSIQQKGHRKNQSSALSDPQKKQNKLQNNLGFFQMDDSEFKIKAADWLQDVCFAPTVQGYIKRQSAYLNSANEYDSLLESALNFLDVNDAAGVNKILEDSANTHSKRAQRRNLTRKENSKFQTKEGEIQENLQNAFKKKDYNEQMRQAEIPLLEPIPQHIIKAYYTLRYLKGRDIKIKLFHIMNYYRSIQKRLCIDLKELNSRMKASGDLEFINPVFSNLNPSHFSNDKESSDINMGPGGIFQGVINRKLDEKDANKQIDHPITIKSYKYNQQFNPKISSSCPCMPRYHSSFGRPKLYENISEQKDRLFVPNKEARRLLGTQDKIIVDEYEKDITVYDEYGLKIIYHESINDLLEIEEELLKTGTFYINKLEYVFDTDSSEPLNAIDRGEMSLNLIESEHKFQFAKVTLIEQFLEVYEHTCDPLEQARLIQIIVDIMGQRPRLNLEATYFVDSYLSEIETFKQQRQFFRELIEFQFQIEEEENKQVNDFIELKQRKINEHMNKDWKYKDEEADEINKIKRAGQYEDENKKQYIGSNAETIKLKLEQNKVNDQEKRQRLMDIANRHITEYAHNQYNDFSEVLGLPEVTAEDIYNKQGEKEKIIVDSLRENAFFQKNMDGYPYKLVHPQNRHDYFGIESRRIGLLDFYDSLCSVSKIYAAIKQSMEDLIKLHTPENGLAHSCLERAIIIDSQCKFKLVRNQEEDQEYYFTKCKNVIEDDFYLGNPDKLIFLMKEFKSEMHPDQIKTLSNPLLIAKLDIDEMDKFDLPRVKLGEIKMTEDMTTEQYISKMIDFSKRVITDPTEAEILIGGNMRLEELLEQRYDSQEKNVIKGPSLLRMCCNLVEVIRLREQLILKIHETDLLSATYKIQLKNVNKESFKIIIPDSLNFDTQQFIKENFNLVDYNDGTKLEIDLPFREFDQSLKANLDFKSQTCIKALLTNLGVEDLRAVLHYQIMQSQILQIAIMLNQELMDGAVKGLYELEFLTKKRPFTIPNSVINISQILSKASDGYNQDLFHREKTKLKQILSREVGDIMYSIATKKQKQRPNIVRKYTNALQKLLANNTIKAETRVRMLKTFRIQLLHTYCKDVLKEAYTDSIKIQLLQVCQDLRVKSQLMAKNSNLFKMGTGEILENLSKLYTQNNSHFYKNNQKYSIQLLTHGRFDSLFYIPSADEIMQLDTKQMEDLSNVTYSDNFIETGLELKLKELVKIPIKNVHYLQNEANDLKISFRKVTLQDAYHYNNNSYKLLNYYSMLFRIFMFEYIIGRNNQPSIEILELEDKVLTGRNYWDIVKEINYAEVDENQISIPDRVINQIVNQKKARIELNEDLFNIENRLLSYNKWTRAYSGESIKIEEMCNILHLQYTKSFAQILDTLESLKESYLEKKDDNNFQKISETINIFMKREQGYQIFYNGFYLFQSIVQPLQLSLDTQMFQDFDQFEMIYQPIVNEENLMPIQIDLIKKIYGQDSLMIKKNFTYLQSSFVKDYKQLENAFFNLSNEDRSYVFTNYYQIEDFLNEYLGKKTTQNRTTLNRDSTSRLQENQHVSLIDINDTFKQEIEILTLKNESRILQQVLLVWIAKQPLPTSTNEYLKIMRIYKDQMIMKILQERDVLLEHDKKEQEKDNNKKQNDQKQFVSQIKKETLQEAIFNQVTKAKVIDKKAELNVLRREIDLRIIKASIETIKQEHSSLLACFEQAATDTKIHAFIHPHQQFASTLYQQVDKNSHLDIVNKLGFVQQFLTRLKNRCTEVETLTSGPGIMKDFNDCLQVFCRGLLKYSEQELRGRVETQFLKQNQYQHLLYLKDQQATFYKRKCEVFLSEIDKLINAKLTQKGNQIVYELDLANRELRMLKDNFYLMERLMRKEIRLDYEKTIQEKDNELEKIKESFDNYKTGLNNEIKEEVAKEIFTLDKKVRQIKEQQKEQNSKTYGLQNQNTSNFNQNKQKQGQGENTNYYDAESRREILSLNKFIRQYKVLTKMKEVIRQEQYERELHNQKQQLTSNACLWEQLGEAEKREQIVKQELFNTQQNLSAYEKLIEKFQAQLEDLQTQKLRLLQYKNSKSKRIEELESKMREVEIMENIDLNKILEELRNREKKIQELKGADRDANQKIQAVNKINQQKIQEINKKYQKEKEIKAEAFNKLETMRLEMKTLEGRDLNSGSTDLWKDKCRELFDICKELQNENEDLKIKVHTMNMQQEQIVKQFQLQQVEPQQQAFSPNSTFKPGQFGPLSVNSYTTKPSTAAEKYGGQSRIMSRAGGTGGANNRGIYAGIHSNPGGDANISSGFSLPDIQNLQQQHQEIVQRLEKDKNLQTITHGERTKEQTISGLNQTQDNIRTYQTATLSDPLGQGAVGGIRHPPTLSTDGDHIQSIMSDPQMRAVLGFNSGKVSNSNIRGQSIGSMGQDINKKRMKTSQGRREVSEGRLGASSGVRHNAALRKSIGQANYKTNQTVNQQALMAQNISQGIFGIPVGSAMPQSSTIPANIGPRQPINLNINFNTTNFNLNK